MWRSIIWLLVLLLLPVAGALLLERPLAALACPRCFGMVQAADGVYVESVMPTDSRAHVLKLLTQAEDRVGRFYGSLEYRPRVLVCMSDGCFQHIGGGGNRVGSMGSFGLMISSQGEDPVLMSHELSHVELHGRVGLWKVFTGAIPVWFDEGVAVLVSDDPVYLRPARGNEDRCKAGPPPNMPETPEDWRDELQQEGDVLYAQAACQTDYWMLGNGGPPAVPRVLARVAGGESFDTIYTGWRNGSGPPH